MFNIRLLTLFMDESTLLGKGSPAHSLMKLFRLFKRLLRFMFCFDAELINKVFNCHIFFLHYHIELSVLTDQLEYSLDRCLCITTNRNRTSNTQTSSSFSKQW